MLRLMTPIDALSYGIKAGMVLGQAQTLWATRLMEMQGFWMGLVPMVPAEPTVPAAADPEEEPAAGPAPVTELHVEAMAVAAEVVVAAEAPAAEAPLAEVVMLTPPDAPKKPRRARAVKEEPPVAEVAVIPFEAAAPEETAPLVAEAPLAESVAAPLAETAVAPVPHLPEPAPEVPAGLALKPVPRRAARREKRAAKTPSAE